MSQVMNAAHFTTKPPIQNTLKLCQELAATFAILLYNLE